MAPLDDFIDIDPNEEILIGTYMFPYILFTGPPIEDPFAETEIVSKIRIENEELLITRNGGLFIRVPKGLQIIPGESDWSVEVNSRSFAFQDKFVDLANIIICEFCLSDIVTEPVTPVHISRAHIRDEHIWISSGGGGREIYLYRTFEPFLKIQTNIWFNKKDVEMDTLRKVEEVELTSKLINVSDNLPFLISSAYSLYSKQQISEALIDSWIVVEQIIDHLWNKFKDTIENSSRLERIKDNRTYSSSVRIEVLYLLNVITIEEYKAFHKARNHRNKLAHRAHISLEWATDGMNAMKLAIEHILLKEITKPETVRGISW